RVLLLTGCFRLFGECIESGDLWKPEDRKPGNGNQAMKNQDLLRLSTLIQTRHDELLAHWRQQVRQLPAAATLDTPSINDQVPELLARLAECLTRNNEPRETNAISAEHGLLRWQAGFDVTEVVAEYNILRQCVQQAAEQDGITLTGKSLHIINDVFDDAIGK